MASPIGRILRQSTQTRPYNILTAITHESVESAMCKTGHNFYAFPHQAFKPRWNTQFRPIPENYNILTNQSLPIDLDFDFVLIQNRFGQYQVLSQLAAQLNLPCIVLEHTIAMPFWTNDVKQQCANMRGDINVFIADYIVDKWGFNLSDTSVRVIRHCIDTELFKPIDIKRSNHVLTINNDYIGRDYCLNYSQFRRVTDGLSIQIVGDTQGLSRPAANIDELISFYQNASVFINCAHLSPIPSVLLEAASMECGIVSCNTCAIPSYFKHGETALLYNNDKEARDYLEIFLNQPNLAREFGKRARQAMIDNFSEEQFVNSWNSTFDEIAAIIYKGQS